MQEKTKEVIKILLAEDNRGDVRLIQEVFKEGKINIELYPVQNGEEALVNPVSSEKNIFMNKSE